MRKKSKVTQPAEIVKSETFEVFHWAGGCKDARYEHRSVHPAERYWEMARELTEQGFNVIVTPRNDYLYVDTVLFYQR